MFLLSDDLTRDLHGKHIICVTVWWWMCQSSSRSNGWGSVRIKFTNQEWCGHKWHPSTMWGLEWFTKTYLHSPSKQLYFLKEAEILQHPQQKILRLNPSLQFKTFCSLMNVTIAVDTLCKIGPNLAPKCWIVVLITIISLWICTTSIEAHTSSSNWIFDSSKKKVATDRIALVVLQFTWITMIRISSK